MLRDVAEKSNGKTYNFQILLQHMVVMLQVEPLKSPPPLVSGLSPGGFSLWYCLVLPKPPDPQSKENWDQRSSTDPTFEQPQDAIAFC